MTKATSCVSSWITVCLMFMPPNLCPVSKKKFRTTPVAPLFVHQSPPEPATPRFPGLSSERDRSFHVTAPTFLESTWPELHGHLTYLSGTFGIYQHGAFWHFLGNVAIFALMCGSKDTSPILRVGNSEKHNLEGI